MSRHGILHCRTLSEHVLLIFAKSIACKIHLQSELKLNWQPGLTH